MENISYVVNYSWENGKDHSDEIIEVEAINKAEAIEVAIDSLKYACMDGGCDVEDIDGGFKSTKTFYNPDSSEFVQTEIYSDFSVSASSEAQELADQIRILDTWDSDLIKKLCDLAGMSEEWEAADGETFEDVAYAAAEKLGVEI